MGDHAAIDHTGLTGISSGSVASDPIWDAAGDLAVGTGADTAGRLAKGAAGGVLAMGNSAVIWNAGTSFPGSKATNDRYWRTDLGMEFSWDGTRWLSTVQHRLAIPAAAQLTADGVGGYAPLYVPASDLWLESAYFMAGLGATNDGSKYWTLDIYKENTGGTTDAVLITGGNTSAKTANQKHVITAAINALAGTTLCGLYTFGTKTSTPSNMLLMATVTYRIVAA
jgi:hypothetical protein